MSRGFYGISPRGFPGKTRRSERVSGPDLYAPSSPQFTERNRKTTSTLANGLTVETIGHVPGTPAPTAAPRHVHPGPERNPAPLMDDFGAPKGGNASLPEYKPGLGRG